MVAKGVGLGAGYSRQATALSRCHEHDGGADSVTTDWRSLPEMNLRCDEVRARLGTRKRRAAYRRGRSASLLDRQSGRNWRRNDLSYYQPPYDQPPYSTKPSSANKIPSESPVGANAKAGNLPFFDQLVNRGLVDPQQVAQIFHPQNVMVALCRVHKRTLIFKLEA